MNSISEYRALIEHTSDVISVLRHDGVITYESPSVERVLGYAQDSLVGENAFEYVHPDDRDELFRRFEHAVANGEDVIDPVEYRFTHADGSWIWLESTGSTRSESALGGFVVTSRDVTERKRQEADLVAQHRKFESLADGLPEVVYRADPETLHTTYVNDSVEDLVGYAPAEWTTDPGAFENAIHPDDRARVLDRMHDLQASFDEGVVEYRVVARDGEVRWVHDHVSWERDETGAVVSQIGIAYDVTELKAYENRLTETVKKLETLNRLVRHDIRNDMTIVLGWAELLEDHVDETGAAYLEKILASGERIVDLTNVVRDYVNAVTSGDAMTVGPMPLRFVIETEVALRREAYPDATFRVVGEIPDVAVAGNETLSSVFQNLLSNAVQHNDAADPVVEVTGDASEDDVVVTVSDNGPGLPAELRDSLFGEGEKSRSSSGSGMGLFLVRRLVDGFGGEIWAENRDEGGAAFHVRLPIVGSESDQDEKGEREQ